jgi:hypothetical protein
LIFGQYSVLWLEKKKIGESFKVQFEEKNPNNGKNHITTQIILIWKFQFLSHKSMPNGSPLLVFHTSNLKHIFLSMTTYKLENVRWT